MLILASVIVSATTSMTILYFYNKWHIKNLEKWLNTFFEEESKYLKNQMMHVTRKESP